MRTLTVATVVCLFLTGVLRAELTAVTSECYESDDLVCYAHIAPGLNAIAVSKHTVPEPAAMSVLDLGGLALLWVRRK
ncbi:MAG: PEP-CTERM sorting domain-containing protein [Planctomycetota bacterium]|jgi:hypothetical protein